MTELKPCPFCGGTKLKIDRKSRLAGRNGLDMRVEMHTYSVRCNHCHARGGAAGGRVIYTPWTRCAPPPDWATTDKALEEKAIEAWNKRAEEVHGRWMEHYRSGVTVTEGGVSSCCDMWNDRRSNYCPHCGAKMDGGADHEAD